MAATPLWGCALWPGFFNILLAALLLAGGAAAPAAAALKWEKTEVELHPTPNDETVAGDFRFVNEGNAPVAITGVQASCTCTRAETDKASYQPGERGALRAVFRIEGRLGTHGSTILVSTDDPQKKPAVLTLKVHIPEPFTRSPESFHWPVGAPATKIPMRLRVVADYPVHIMAARSDSDAFACELETVQEAREYVLTVVPTQTKVPAAATIHVQAFIRGRPQLFTLPAAVSGSPPEGS